MATAAENRDHLNATLDSDDDEQVVQPRRVARQDGQGEFQRAAKIKLAPLWQKKVQDWFVLTESTFHRHQILDSRLRFDLVLPALADDTLEQLGGVLRLAGRVADPYQVLKERLVELYSPAVIDLMYQLIWGAELGGRRPSQMMESMLALLPEGEPDGLLFKAHFVSRLPTDIRDQVAIHFEAMESRQLAKLADGIWFARNSRTSGKPAAAVMTGGSSSTDDEQTELPVAAVQFKKKIRGRSGPASKPANKNKNKGGQQGGSSSQVTVCARHKKFGAEAWKCDDPSNCFLSSTVASGN